MTRLGQLGVADRVETPRPDDRLVEPRVRVGLLHRAALMHAAGSGARRVLILEDHCLLLADAEARLGAVLHDLDALPWAILSLGSHPDRRSVALAKGCTCVAEGNFEGSFALAYTATAVVDLLAEVPADAPRLADWVEQHESYDRFLSTRPGRLLCVPHLASLPHLLAYEDPVAREGYLA